MATPDPPDRDGTGGRARVGRAHAAVSHASQQAGSAPARVTAALRSGEEPQPDSLGSRAPRGYLRMGSACEQDTTVFVQDLTQYYYTL